ncbi:MAG: hypothetical protein GEV11_22910, partial [Streptosporangiales bacterium]|nr:hypothetical protein [Streptosporangiales bacterium]
MIPEVDGSGRSFAVMAFGAVAHTVAECWARRIEMADARLWAWHGERADGEALRALRAELGRARVGWRLMLAGPEADVRPARAEAVTHGAVPAEIRAHITPGAHRVYCPACATVTLITQGAATGPAPLAPPRPTPHTA